MVLKVVAHELLRLERATRTQAVSLAMLVPLPVQLLLLLLVPPAPAAQAAPLTPNFTSCSIFYGIPEFPANPTNCCTMPELMRPGGPVNYIEWQQYIRDNPLPARPRLRRAAHLPGVAANSTYLEQLDRAYRLWRALPDDDPRSVYQIAKVHCIYGGSVVAQLGHPDLDYTVHANWPFFPFHRWFTFFFERILGKLVEDDDFALPFWNVDSQTPLEPLLPNILPPFHRQPEKYPGLYHSARDPRHRPGQPPRMADLQYNPLIFPDHVNPDDIDPEQLREDNNAFLHHYIVANTAAPFDASRALFFDAPRRHGDEWHRDSDWFEFSVHIGIHFWMADPGNHWEDMGQVYSAVRDPVFFTYHTNVDRMWGVYETLPGRRNFDDSDFLDAEFFFYNEDAQLVRVTVADCLDITKLGYAYQEVENPWISYNPRPVKEVVPQGTSHPISVS